MKENTHQEKSWANPWLILALIGCAAAVAQAFGRFSFGVLYPAIRDDLAVSNTIAALLGASNVGMYLVGTLCVAWATSRVSLLSTFRVGLLLSTSGLGVAAFADTAGQLAVGLAIAGFGGACVWIPAPAIAADAMPDRHRNIAVGLMGSGIGVGIVFVSMLTAQLRPELGDAAWSEVYKVQAWFALLVLVAVLTIVRHAQAPATGRRGAGGLVALRRMKGWMPLIIAYTIFGFMYLLVIGFLTSRLEDDSGWASSDAAYAFTLMGVAMVMGAPLFVAMANRTGVRRALCLAFLLWPLLVMVVLSGEPAVTHPAVIGLGLLFSALPSLITVYVVRNTAPADYGPTFAIATLAFGVAQVISPPIGGLIADLSGSFTLVFALSALMGFSGFFAVWRLPKD